MKTPKFARSLSLLLFVSIIAPGTLLTGCIGMSPGVRSHVLPKGELRLGGGWIISPNQAEDFVRAEPSFNEGDEGTSASLTPEASIFYGVTDRLDVGLRLRPFGNGGKVEALWLLLPGKKDEMKIMVGLGLDGTQTDVHVGSDEVGSYDRKIMSLVVDMPIIVTLSPHRIITLFAAGRMGHQYLNGDQSYTSHTEAFETLTVHKEVSTVFVGANLGAEFHIGRVFHIMPQLTYFQAITDMGQHSPLIAPMLEFGFEF